jgi:phosphoethanolamine N-methyltransferase
MTAHIAYPDEFIDRLEVVWGAGFLSPGGEDEVLEILRDIDLRNKVVLDIGCGVAGPAIVITREFEPQKVIGIDIEHQLIIRGKRNVANEGLDNQIDLKLVEPGALPFPDASFDAVFSKDSLIHIEDKSAFYKEILRVLKPGGAFVASDWLKGEDAESLPEYELWRKLAHLSFVMQTASETEAVLQSQGFKNVSSRDRNDWFSVIARRDCESLEGPLRDEFIQICGEETFKKAVEIRRSHIAAADCGGLRPTHIRGFKAT